MKELHIRYAGYWHHWYRKVGDMQSILRFTFGEIIWSIEGDL